MSTAIHNERRRLEATLGSPRADFIAKFLAVRSLHELLRDTPGAADADTVAVLAATLADPGVAAERQGLFLFREAAAGLRVLFTVATADRCLADSAMASLHQVLRHATGAAQRATAETLAGLPLALSPPCFAPPVAGPHPSRGWSELVDAAGSGPCRELSFVGRSLVGRLASGELLVVKLARPGDRPAELAREPAWLAHLAAADLTLPPGFALPSPLGRDHRFAFRLRDLPLAPPADLALHPQRFAVAFVAPADYYRYPNEPENGLAGDRLVTLLAGNARLLGELAGQGILHEAVIPLFHNRVQRERRVDGGVYNWVLAGRLDRWLDSCRHPNFGISGLRDFEHLVPLTPRTDLYRELGAHFLSLLLVAASVFRNRAPGLRGTAANGAPVDARHLFDAPLLARIIEAVYRHYHQGFAGVPAPAALPFDLARLCARMIDEMGVDRHMEEVLRIADQQAMDDAAFADFLRSRGFPARQVARCVRGRAEILLATGPHLGGFNQAISLPELVAAVGGMAAMCVLGRYRAEQGAAASLREQARR